MQNPSITSDDDDYALVVLSFFRDIDDSERVKILSQLDMIPSSFKGSLTHSLERRFLDKAKEAGRVDEIKSALNALIQKS